MATSEISKAMAEYNMDRLRSGQACRVCRKRKNKCDGTRPACGFCTKRGSECVYDNPYKSMQIDEGYVESLEEKVRKLEEDLRQSVGQARESALGRAESRTSDASLVQGLQVNEPIATQKVLSSDNRAPIRTHSGAPSLEVGLEFVKVIKYNEISIHSALADFGLAPSDASKRQRQSSPDPAPDSSLPEGTPHFTAGNSNEPSADRHILPPKALANRLADLFFEHTAPELPVVHEPTFRRMFSLVYERNNKPSISFQALLNAVFAFGCDNLDLSLSQIYELSQMFHRRATGLIISVCYDIATFEVVQAFLLVTLHLNSNMQFNRMWTNTGLLVRMSQALGLHLDPSHWDISTVEKELRKRIWWSIHALDRFISLKFCRPPALTVEGYPVSKPEIVDDEQITEHGFVKSASSQTRKPSSMHYFNSLLDLIYVSETVLMSTYRDTPWFLPSAANETSRESNNIGSAQLYTQLELLSAQEGKLSAWLVKLPQHLQFDYRNSDSRLKKQQRTLQIRYLHARLVIHRQSVIATIRRDKERAAEQSDHFLRSVMAASVRQCLDCACKLVELIEEYSKDQSLGPWWLNVQFIFTTLATLFAVKSRPSIIRTLDESAVNLAIDTAMDYLRSLGAVNPTMKKCQEYFESLNTWAANKKSSLDAGPSTRRSFVPSSIPKAPTVQSSISANAANHPTESNFGLQIHPAAVSHDQDEFDIFDMDQLMADYPFDLFPDPLLRDLDFGQEST
ncbi:fungal-specific transcription factor domain-containing protein [Lineolata rhizophorae]|uniref:Fungal-specific transcription factor domain-containing protein n=1 Tax=Lineolata rhizophorae TaxID=578093 RepID=A0A6A6PBK6_9PEZI|nr:fungal-specific transcription factor domain-containing protein [Lineolata rhizophorae]